MSLIYRYVFPENHAAERARAILKRIKDVPNPLVAEIGVFAGALSTILLAARPDLQLLMVDPYDTYEQSEDYKATGDYHTTMSAGEHLLARKRALWSTEFAWFRREVCLKPSVVAAKDYERQFDLVFIDGDHSYKGCKEDILAWMPLVKLGGWLSGHDYRTDLDFGVKQAVDEMFPKAELDDNFTWFVRV